jgi:hypothetical protein
MFHFSAIVSLSRHFFKSLRPNLSGNRYFWCSRHFLSPRHLI